MAQKKVPGTKAAKKPAAKVVKKAAAKTLKGSYGFLVASTTIPPRSTTVIPVALPPASRLNVTRQPRTPASDRSR